MPRLDARLAAYIVATILALSFSYDLMRKPIQVSDSLQELLDVQESPSVFATFVAHSPRGPFLRPLKQVQTKVLFDLADGHYWLVFRGFHALLLAGALFLFTRALRVQTWADFAAAVFALTVLTGLHTFRGTVREAALQRLHARLLIDREHHGTGWGMQVQLGDRRHLLAELRIGTMEPALDPVRAQFWME